MKFQDYYKTLGIEKTATAEEIKKAYRRLARKYHPDVSSEKNAEEKFKEVKEAYEVLKDPEKRKAYDQMGSGHHSGDNFNPPPGWEFNQRQQNHSAFDQADFSEFFSSIFNQRGRHWEPRAETGTDQHAKIELGLEEAYQGTTRTLNLQMGMNTRTLKVKIPAGAGNGQRIRLAGQGSAGIHGGKPGDLYLEIIIKPHSHYTLEGNDVYLTLPITPWEAALGATLKVPTLGGTVDLKIPGNSQSGQKLRLKGRGLGGKNPGDQFVLLKIQIPPANTPEERELYEKMAELMPFNPRAHLNF